MTQVTGPFPYDVANLLGGAARLLYAPLTVAIPVKMGDIIKLTSALNYAPNTGWLDFGATKESAHYNRNIDESGYEIQQASGVVLNEVTGVTRTLQVSLAEIKKEHLVIMEESPGATAIASTAGNSAQDAVPFGNITDLTRYRFALIAQRKKQSVMVTEPVAGGSPTRGGFVCVVLYEATLSADASEMEFNKGDLVSTPITFNSYPAAGQTAGKEFSTYFIESAGVMT